MEEGGGGGFKMEMVRENFRYQKGYEYLFVYFLCVVGI